MGLLQRVTATLVTSVDKVVSQVENHDAIIEANINNGRRTAAAAKVRLARVRKEIEHHTSKRCELEASAKRWATRAKAVAVEDEGKAMACLRRRRACAEDIARLDTVIARERQVEEKVGATVAQIERRLAEITAQRNMMRSRHSAAEALRVISKAEGSAGADIEETFDRWEMSITEAEFDVGEDVSPDALESEFEKAEDAESLRAELELLLSDDGEKTHD